MGVQNFSGGGFYGKVGTVVGYRKNGQFVLKKYVVPTNPKTPAQQANRGKMRVASKLSSFSNNLNRGTPCISLDGLGNSAARCKIAFANVKAGASELNQIPVFDEDHYPPFIASQCSFVRYSGDTVILFVAGVLPTEERTISVVLNPISEKKDFCEWLISAGTFTPTSSGGRLVLQNPFGEVWEENSQIMFISNDDYNHQNQNFWLPETTLSLKLPEERVFDSTIISFSRSLRTFTIVFAEDYFQGVQSFDQVSVHCVSDGVWGDFLLENPSFQNSNGKFSLTFAASGTSEANLWAFPVNSEITFSGFTISSDELILTAPPASISLVNSSDLVRNLDEISNSIPIQIKDNYITYDFEFYIPAGILKDYENLEDGIFKMNRSKPPSSSDLWVLKANNLYYQFALGQFSNLEMDGYIDGVITDADNRILYQVAVSSTGRVTDIDYWRNNIGSTKNGVWENETNAYYSFLANGVTYNLSLAVKKGSAVTIS